MPFLTNGQLSIVDEGDISIEISPSLIFIDVYSKYTPDDTNHQINIYQNIAQHHYTQEVCVTIKDAYGKQIHDLSEFVIEDNLNNTYINGKYMYSWNYGDCIQEQLITITITNTQTHTTTTGQLLIVPRFKPQVELNEKTLFLYHADDNTHSIPVFTYNWTEDSLFIQVRKNNNTNEKITYYVTSETDYSGWYRANSISEIIEQVDARGWTNALVTSTHLIQSRNDYLNIVKESIDIQSTQWYSRAGQTSSSRVFMQLIKNNSNELEERVVYLYKNGSWGQNKSDGEFVSWSDSIPDIVKKSSNSGSHFSFFSYDIDSDCIRQDNNFTKIRQLTNNNVVNYNIFAMDRGSTEWHTVQSELTQGFYSLNSNTLVEKIAYVEAQVTQTFTNQITGEEETSTIYYRKPRSSILVAQSILIHKAVDEHILALEADDTNNRRWSTPIDLTYLFTPVYLNVEPQTSFTNASQEQITINLTDITGLEDTDENNTINSEFDYAGSAGNGYLLYNKLWNYLLKTKEGNLDINDGNGNYIDGNYEETKHGRLIAHWSTKDYETQIETEHEGTNLIYNNQKYEINGLAGGGFTQSMAIWNEDLGIYEAVAPRYDDDNTIEITFTTGNSSAIVLNSPIQNDNLNYINGNIKIIQLYFVSDSTTFNSNNLINGPLLYQFSTDTLYNTDNFILPQGWQRSIPSNISNENHIFIIEAAVLSDQDLVEIRATQWTIPTLYDATYTSKTLFLYHHYENTPLLLPTGQFDYHNTNLLCLDQKINMPTTAVPFNTSLINNMNGWYIYPRKTSDQYAIIAVQVIPNQTEQFTSGNTTLNIPFVENISANRLSNIIYTHPSSKDLNYISTTRQIVSVQEQYFLSTSAALLSGDGQWESLPPAWSAGRYYWVRNAINWDDGTMSYTSPKLASNDDILNAAAAYINAASTAINKVFKQSSRPTQGYHVGDLWYCTRVNSSDIIEYICISETDGAPMSDWVLFNRLMADTIMNVDTKSGIIDILATLNLNLSANKVLTASGNEKVVVGSDGNIELYAGDGFHVVTGAIDGHLNTLIMDKIGTTFTGQNINLLSTLNTMIHSNGNIQITSDYTDNSYIRFGTDLDPNKLLLSPKGIEAVSGNFESLRVNNKNVLTEDWLSHKIIVSALKPAEHDVIWIYPEDTYGIFTDISTDQIRVIASPTPLTSTLIPSHRDRDVNKANILPVTHDGYTYDPNNSDYPYVSGTGRIGFGAPGYGAGGSLVNYAYDEYFKQVSPNSSYIHEHSINMDWEQIGIQQWTTASIIMGVDAIEASYMASLQIAVIGSVDNHQVAVPYNGVVAVVREGRLDFQDYGTTYEYHYERGYQQSEAGGNLKPIIIPAGSELRIQCDYKEVTFRDIADDYPDGISGIPWNRSFTKPGERRGTVLGGIFRTIEPVEIKYNEVKTLTFYSIYNINTETNTVDYSNDPHANLSGRMAWYYYFKNPQNFDPTYKYVDEWHPYTVFRWPYIAADDPNQRLLRHMAPTGNSAHPYALAANRDYFPDYPDRREYCVPMVLHPSEVGLPYYQLILTKKQTVYYHDEQLLNCRVNYVI